MNIRRMGLALAAVFALLVFSTTLASAGATVPLDQLQVTDEDIGVALDNNGKSDAWFYRPAVGYHRPAVGYHRPAVGYHRPATGYYRPY